jgi:hypothetical protein
MSQLAAAHGGITLSCCIQLSISITTRLSFICPFAMRTEPFSLRDRSFLEYPWHDGSPPSQDEQSDAHRKHGKVEEEQEAYP